MLQSFRKFAKTKFASVIIGGLILAFALWGVNDIFRGGGETDVAEVGGTPIPAQQFDREFQAQLRNMSQQTQNPVTTEQARALGLDKAVLNNIISRAALDAEMRRLGLAASDQAVADYVRNSDNFRGTNGAFDRNLFLQTLQQNGYTEAEYITLARQDMEREQLLNAVSDGIAPPPGLTRLFYDFVNETRQLSYFTLTPADAGKIPAPTDDQLKQYHTAHAEEFTAPEYRNIQYVSITPADVASQVQVSDKELHQEYDARKATFNTPEKRQIEQITFPDEATAKAGAAKLAGGEDFAKLATERGLKPEDINLGTLSADALAPALSKAAFATPEGKTTMPVKGPFGWVILKVAKIVPGTNKTFDEMKDTLRKQLVDEKAKGKMADLANAFEDARAGGATLAEAAKKLGLTVHTVAAVDAKGKTPDGGAADVPMNMMFLSEIFDTAEGEESPLFETDNGNSYAIRTIGVTPSALKPLAKVHDEVVKDWEDQARTDALRMRAEMLAAQARKGTIDEAAKTAGKKIMTTAALKRDANDAAIGAAVLQDAFSEPKGSIVSGPTADGKNYVVAAVSKVDHPTPDLTSAQYGQFRTSMTQQLGADAVEMLAAAARTDVGVKTYPQAVNQVLGGPAQ